MIAMSNTDPFKPTPEDQDEALKWLGPNCMDLGCGPNPLPGAKFLYDIRDYDNPDITQVDFYAPGDLVEEDNFDYRNVYCRHVLEDLRYPEVLLDIFGVCKRGWIETPHPTVEISRGVDCGAPWRGFSHHYWFIWNDGGVLTFLPKTPMIEHLSSSSEGAIRHWNTYYKWDNYNFKYKILEHGIDFDFRDNSYLELLKRGLNA